MKLRIYPTHTYDGTPVHVVGDPFQVVGNPPGIKWVAGEFPDQVMRPCNTERLVPIPPAEVVELPRTPKRKRWWRR